MSVTDRMVGPESSAWAFPTVGLLTNYGGATCPVMGAVFKTVCRVARAGLGGFDSHTPPPKISRPQSKWQQADSCKRI